LPHCICYPISPKVISRRWRPSPRPLSADNVSVIDGLYRLDGTGEFVSPGSQWGSARYIETLVMSDADEYETSTTATQIIAGVEYVFTATTRAEIVEPITDIDGGMLSDIDLNTLTGAA